MIKFFFSTLVTALVLTPVIYLVSWLAHWLTPFNGPDALAIAFATAAFGKLMSSLGRKL